MTNQIPTLEARRRSRFATIEEYLDSGLTQKQFCAQAQIAYSTFQFWLKKYRKLETGTRQSNNNFVPLKFAPPQIDSSYYTLQYPNGVVVHVHGTISVQTLVELISAVTDPLCGQSSRG
jgi:hypothetical protein